MTPEIARISDQLRRAVEGEAWHGPSVMEVLKGVDARAASAHPIVGAHSIWELLHHITAWTRAIMRRMDGQAVQLSGATDFPPVTDTADAPWQAAIASFRNAQTELLKKLESVSDQQLAATVPGRDYTYLFMFDGLVHHHLYHGGQMALLKKAAAQRLG